MDAPHIHVKKKVKLVKVAIIFAIVIVLNLFFNYAISLAYNAPKYEDFVKPSQIVEPIENKSDCLKVGGQWTDANNYPNPVSVKTNINDNTKPLLGYCDPNYTNQINFNNAQKNYDRNVFIILVILGVISIVVGVVSSSETLSIAFSWAGVISLILGSMRYWNDANNLLKVIILAIALGVLIWVAIKKIEK